MPRRQKFKYVMSVIERRIRQGDYVLAPIPGERKIAEETGVSHMTARKAVRGLLEQKVLIRRPNGLLDVHPGRQGDAAAAHFLLLYPAYASTYLTHLRQMVSDAAEQYGLSMRPVQFVHWDDPVVTSAASNPVGVIFISSAEDVPAHVLRTLRESKSVSLDRDLSELNVPSIRLFPDAHIVKVFSHLHEQGHRRIDCISTQYHNPEIERRIRLWREYLHENHLTGELHERPTRSFGDATQAAYDLMRELLANAPLESKAFVGTTFPAAVGAIRACYEKRLELGRDVAICAINIESPARFMTPSVTGLDTPNLTKLLRQCFDWFSGSASWRGNKCLEPSRARIFSPVNRPGQRARKWRQKVTGTNYNRRVRISLDIFCSVITLNAGSNSSRGRGAALYNLLGGCMNVSSSSRRKLTVAITLLAGGALCAQARAAKILVDMGSAGSFRGVSVPAPDANGNRWNSVIPGVLVPSLIDTTGAATGIGLGFDTPIGTDSFNGPAGATSFPNPTPAEIAAADAAINKAALGDLGIAEAVIDFAASPGTADNSTIFDLQNLNPAQTYTLKLYGSHIFSTNSQTKYSVYSNFDASHVTDPANGLTGLQATANLDVQFINQADPGHPPNVPNGDGVATLSGLTPNANGILFVDFIGAGGSLGYLNAFELISGTVPEPTSLGLAAVAGLLLARRARERRCSLVRQFLIPETPPTMGGVSFYRCQEISQ